MTREHFIALGGKEWKKGKHHRVYITSDVFNELMETRFSDRSNKFFFDCNKNALMRSYKNKAPKTEKQF